LFVFYFELELFLLPCWAAAAKRIETRKKKEENKVEK
jgi:hypothetical protein